MTQCFFFKKKVTIQAEILEKFRNQVQEHTFSIFTLLGLGFSLKNFCRGKKASASCREDKVSGA